MTLPNPNFEQQGADITLKRRASHAAIATALLLIIIKTAAWMTTDSVSILSSLADSSFDLIASLIILLSITRAAVPADRDHRFGHGKIEALGALAQAVFVLAAVAFLVIESLRRIVEPQIVTAPLGGIAAMILSMIVTAILIRYQRKIAAQTGSVAVAADSLHYAVDFLSNMAVLAGLAITHITGMVYADPVFAIAVALYLAWSARGIGRMAFRILLDQELDQKTRDSIKKTVTGHPAVRGIHDLRTRSTGERTFIEFHIELDPAMPLKDVHDVMDTLEESLYDLCGKCEVTIHPEPAGIDDHRLDHTLGR